jgi:hypothetical protein
VGKGLSKDEKAKKLALQHWLEAVSPMLEVKSLNQTTSFYLWPILNLVLLKLTD